MKLEILVLFLVTLFLASCKPMLYTQLNDDNDKGDLSVDSIAVFSSDLPLRYSYKRLGSIETKTALFPRKSNHNQQIDVLKQEAVKLGANAIYVVEAVKGINVSNKKNLTVELLSVDYTSPKPVVDTDVFKSKGRSRYISPYWELGLNADYGYLLGANAEQVRIEQLEYIEALKNALVFGADLSFFYSGRTGLGIDILNAMRSNRLDQRTMSGGERRNFFIEESIYQRYYGLHYKAKLLPVNADRWYSSMSLGGGMMYYTNKTHVLDGIYGVEGQPTLLRYKAQSPAGLFKFEYAYKYSERMALGAHIGVLGVLHGLSNNYWTTRPDLRSIKKESTSLFLLGVNVKYMLY